MQENQVRDDVYISYSGYDSDSSLAVVIDPGHGGMLYGDHQTPEKTFKHKWGTFDEGEFNRAIAVRLSKRLLVLDIAHYFSTDSNIDVSLPIRCSRANSLQKLYPEKKFLFLSIHGNAFVDQRANGIEVWTSPGQDKSDEYATEFYYELEKLGWKMRKDMSDGDVDKESRFYVLVNTDMPSVLLELGFYSNPEEAKKMLTDKYQDKIVDLLTNVIKKINEKD